MKLLLINILILIVFCLNPLVKSQNFLIPPTIIEYKASFTNVDIVWKDQNYHGIKYQIYRSIDGSFGWIKIATVDYKWTPYYSDNIGYSTKRFYKVNSYDPLTDDTSDFSNIINVTTPSAPNGIIYYVDATDGSDSNSGTSEDKPWKTLEKVNNSAKSFVSGTRVLFKRGEIWKNQSLNLTSGGGTSSNSVVFDAYGIGSKPIIQAVDGIKGIFCNRSYYVFRNFNIKSSNANGIANDGGYNETNQVIEHCRVENINPTSTHTAGIRLINKEPLGNSRISWNEVSGYTVLISYGRGQNSFIEFNFLHDADGGSTNDQDCIGAGASSSNNLMGTVIRYNHMTAWGDDAIDVQQGGYNITFEYNYAHHPKSSAYEGNGLKIAGSPQIIRYNIIHSLSTSGIDGGNGNNNGIELHNEGVECYGNVLWDIDGEGIRVTNYGVGRSIGSHKVYNNTISSSNGAIICESSLNNTSLIQNNILNSYGPGPDLKANNESVIGGYNLLINDTSISGGSKYSGVSKDIYKTDPLFINVNMSDFRLKENSPCIDAGIQISGFTSDILGTLILSSSKPCIGAIQIIDVDSNQSSGIRVNIKIFLEGAYFGDNSMSTTLKDSGVLPNNQPFNTDPWKYSGSESVKNFSENIVDWVLVELRTRTSSSSKISTKAALLKSNGHIVDLDGNSPLLFDNVASGNYYIVIKHRNHLSIMSAISLALSNTTNIYDFSNSINKAYGNASMANLGNGVYGMFGGDGEANGLINSKDFNEVSSYIFETGYINCDQDMNGIVNVLDYGKSNSNQNKSVQFQE